MRKIPNIKPIGIIDANGIAKKIVTRCGNGNREIHGIGISMRGSGVNGGGKK
jgi:hypothetical protein